jgi:hypothetical protein
VFLRAVARALRFPDYFGFNWKVLADCVTGLEWLDHDDMVRVPEAVSRFAACAPRDFATVVDVLAEAADYWALEGVALIVLLEASAKPALDRAPAVRTGPSDCRWAWRKP